MKLHSVNVSLPRQVTHRGRTYLTSIFKQPAVGRVMARRTNLDGDGQGNLVFHGGPHMAVYVYSLDHYIHWAGELGAGELALGYFGENLTVEGMMEDEVRIGDSFRIGDALFQVSEPRTPCHKLAMRTGRANFPRAFLASLRVGFYFRVLEEGAVGAGDEIEKVESNPASMTVAEVTRLWVAGKDDRAGMERALELPALSPTWCEVFQKRIESLKEQVSVS